MSQALWDTHDIYEELVDAGVSQGQAKALTSVFRMQNQALDGKFTTLEEKQAKRVSEELATRADLEIASLALKGDIASLRTELKGDTASLRTELKGDIASLRTELKGDTASLRTELKGDIASLRTELKGDIASLRAELKGDTASLRTELKGDIADLRNAMSRQEVRLIKWMLGLIGGAVITLIGTIGTMIARGFGWW